MKRHIFLIIILICTACLLSSCEKAPFLVLNSSNSISISGQGGSQVVSFSSNRDYWAISSSESWCVVSPPSQSTSNGEISFSINCNPNPNYDSRSALVTIKIDDLLETITVTQDAKQSLIISPLTYSVDCVPQTLEISIQSNINYSVNIDKDCSSWISIVSTKALSKDKLVLGIAGNESYDDRKGTVTVKQIDGTLSETIVVKQNPSSGLIIPSSEYDVSREDQTIDVEIQTNIALDVIPLVDWIHYIETKALSSKTVSLRIDFNTSLEKRTGTVLIKQQDGSLEQMIVINQDHDEVIVFKDAKIKEKCVDRWDIDNDGELSYGEAAAVTSIEGVFAAIKTYSSFDEFKYFTGVKDIPELMFKDWHITSIILPQSIETIGEGAFQNCSQLSSTIEIPESVKKIPNFCFDGCSNLPKVEYSTTLSSIGNGAFRNCTKLSSINLPDGIKSIGVRSFAGCSSLSTVRIPGSISSLGFEVFFQCTGLRSVIIEEGVSSISDIIIYAYIDKYHGCFTGCSNLEEVSLPESLTIIGTGAFENCSSLSKINLPEGLKVIQHAAFAGCTSLTEISIPESVTGIGGSYSIGGRVVARGAFSDCISLRYISLPSTLTVLDDRLFYNCSSLSSITIPETVSSIGKYTFYNCASLSSCSIPESVSSIGEGAFYGCISIDSIIIPPSVVTIGRYCFRDCHSLKGITIPESVNELGQQAFSGCLGLKSVSFSKSINTIRTGLFEGCISLASIDIPVGIEGIYDYAFKDCVALSSIVIPDSVLEIGGSAFEGCHSLSSIVLPEGLKCIFQRTFKDCISLSCISIPESVTRIGGAEWWANGREYGGAFEGCISLQEIIVPKNVTYIGDSAFEGCNKLNRILMYPIDPPTFNGTRVFSYTNNCPIYVPAESVDSYKTAEYWSYYSGRIQPIQ